MITFKDDLKLKWLKNSIYFELLEPFICNYNDILIIVPKGFKTDLATIPPFFRMIVDYNDRQIRDAAVIHDWLYSKECTILDRNLADLILKEIMIDAGMDKWKVNLIYKIVRIFGKKFYKI